MTTAHESMRVILASLASLLVLIIPSAAALSGPPSPTNLEVVAVTEDSITLAWGPSQPGPLYNAGEEKNHILVAWGPSEDSRSAVTYTLQKDGAIVASNLVGTSYRITVNQRVKSFRTCVVASNIVWQTSPPMCATWTRV